MLTTANNVVKYMVATNRATVVPRAITRTTDDDELHKEADTWVTVDSNMVGPLEDLKDDENYNNWLTTKETTPRRPNLVEDFLAIESPHYTSNIYGTQDSSPKLPLSKLPQFREEFLPPTTSSSSTTE